MVRMTTNPMAHDAAPKTTMTEKMRMAGDVARPRQGIRKCRSKWSKAHRPRGVIYRLVGSHSNGCGAICRVGHNHHKSEGECSRGERLTVRPLEAYTLTPPYLPMRKVRVWPIVPNPRIPSGRSQMDQNEIHTSNKDANLSSRRFAGLQRRSDVGNRVSCSWQDPASSQAELKGKNKDPATLIRNPCGLRRADDRLKGRTTRRRVSNPDEGSWRRDSKSIWHHPIGLSDGSL